MVLDSGLHARDSGFHVQVKIFWILESGLPYIRQGVVADIHRWGTDLEVYLLVSFRDICYISTQLDLQRSDIYRRMLFLQQIANF